MVVHEDFNWLVLHQLQPKVPAEPLMTGALS
jgi:hypothetical protein